MTWREGPLKNDEFGESEVSEGLWLKPVRVKMSFIPWKCLSNTCAYFELRKYMKG